MAVTMTTQTLSQAVTHTSRIKLWGKISAIFFFLAALAVVDGLQALARHDFNSFELIPGETAFISGMLPEGVTTHEDLQIHVQGVQGLTVRPVASFKGFWLGGQMWRAEIKVPEFAIPGQASLTVVDLVRPTRKVSQDEANGVGRNVQTSSPDMVNVDYAETTEVAQEELPLVQNPMLVYGVTIWPSALDRQRAEKSFVRKISGFSSFWLAGLAAIVAILAGVKGWFTFATVEKQLAAKGLYIVHGVKKPGSPSPSGYESDSWQALCAYFGDVSLNVGDAVTLFDSEARPRGEGIVREMRSDGFMAAFPANEPAPVYSWIIAKRAFESDD